MTADPPPDRCGTELGYQDHLAGVPFPEDNGGDPCGCRRAHAAKRADYRRRRYLNHSPLSVDATGTRRRLQALAAVGWSLAEQSRRLGWHESTAHRVASRQWVWVETAEKVRGLYDELAMTPGTNRRARNDAARKGWPPPLAWSDEEIDDPDATPAVPVDDGGLDELAVEHVIDGATMRLTGPELLAAAIVLNGRGHDYALIAARCRSDVATVRRVLNTAQQRAIREAAKRRAA